jgi:hypothetical protein|tara:strand:- start:44 stop:160 length:117 start_codon:yes stop_codon:yes gene_type:complete
MKYIEEHIDINGNTIYIILEDANMISFHDTREDAEKNI